MLTQAQGMLGFAPGQQHSHPHVVPLLSDFDAILVPPASVPAAQCQSGVHCNLIEKKQLAMKQVSAPPRALQSESKHGDQRMTKL